MSLYIYNLNYLTYLYLYLQEYCLRPKLGSITQHGDLCNMFMFSYSEQMHILLFHQNKQRCI